MRVFVQPVIGGGVILRRNKVERIGLEKSSQRTFPDRLSA